MITQCKQGCHVGCSMMTVQTGMPHWLQYDDSAATAATLVAVWWQCRQECHTGCSMMTVQPRLPHWLQYDDSADRAATLIAVWWQCSHGCHTGCSMMTVQTGLPHWLQYDDSADRAATLVAVWWQCSQGCHTGCSMMTLQPGLPHWLQVVPKSADRWIVVKMRITEDLFWNLHLSKLDVTVQLMGPRPKYSPHSVILHSHMLYWLLKVLLPLLPVTVMRRRCGGKLSWWKQYLSTCRSNCEKTRYAAVLQTGNQTRDSPNMMQECHAMDCDTPSKSQLSY
jgi:hypothetical protein